MGRKKKIEEKAILLTSERVKQLIELENGGLTNQIKKNEKIWLKGNIGVRKANIKLARTPEEINEYIKCKIDVHYFADNYCFLKSETGAYEKVPLYPLQHEILELYNTNRYSLLNISRQMSKTTTTSIFLLWYCLFNETKNVMLLANQTDTVKEVIDKIKNIYLYLPFFLKKGVINWNQKNVVFENKCRIISRAATKEGPVGYTIDVLYIDEFAKIANEIITDYYTSAVPIVARVTNSKIIVTSTPCGYNLFHKLYSESSPLIDESDPNWNQYRSITKYWWELKWRRNTKLYINEIVLKNKNITKEELKEWLISLDFIVEEKIWNNRNSYTITFDDKDDRTNIEEIRKLRYNNIPLPDIFNITNWKEEETKLIGGEDAFKQEYDLQFVTSNKLLFDTVRLEQFYNNCENFEHISIDSINKKLLIPYGNLKWLKGKPEIFNINDIKKYYIFASIDLAEGLGQDYSVINIFRIMKKNEEEIFLNKHKFTNKYDYFKLEQIGLFRNNTISIRELAHLFYCIFFVSFNPEQVKVALEYNTYGANLITNLMHVFEDHNEFSNGIFARYKHRDDDIIPKIGLKITGQNKKIYIQEFQNHMRKDDIILHYEPNINEIKMFAKKETPSGDFTYESESGHDDMVMSLVTLSSLFNNISFKNLIDTFIEKEVSEDFKALIEGMTLEDNSKIDYSSIRAYRKIYGNKNTPKPVNNTKFNQFLGNNRYNPYSQ